ncbi:MAG TPA: STAS domain-containing protein [Spirochaetota bacterium]|nr:STAS domain-containing protein [Spirochaetota bacterium]HOD14032.1 STAS domain-containing protein [Spirochaetota bacterium]HPG49806.1 STAS domain-containing protein [Spirochaetota bacterium]HPN13984.1 STAS domain-containing protein [Spirochaetota bacterium]HQL82718.1 STAS domain-containing protein [Spirochaetota bacterium]
MVTIEINDPIIATLQDNILNVHNSQVIFRQLEETVREHRKDLVLNLEHVRSCDSSTIASFVELQTLVKSFGKELSIINISPFVMKIFDMLHIKKLFNVV